MSNPPTPEELAAILAALAARRTATGDATPYESWRKQRIEVLRRRT